MTLGDLAMKERIDSERNQGRAVDMGWLEHDRLGFNYRLSEIACALGIAQLERLEEMLLARSRLAERYREALLGIEGSSSHVRTATATHGDGSCSSCNFRMASIVTRRYVRLPSLGFRASHIYRLST